MDAFGLELELERIEARFARICAEAAEAAWAGGVGPRLPGDEPTRRTLAAARVLPGDGGQRAARLWRMAVEAQAVAADTARAVPLADRTEARMIAARDLRNATARRLGFADAWTLARVVANDDDAVPGDVSEPPAEPAREDHAAFAAVLDDPRALVDQLARRNDLDPAVITVDIVTGGAPTAGRTYVIAPGRDVRVRVWRRPAATARGTVRVLLHELGHAFLAASWRDLPWAMCAPPSLAFDEATAAWTASLLEHDDFLARIGAPPHFAALERATRARRRARLVATARAEHAFLTSDGPAPWRDHLAWTDPGASHTYAIAETLRDAFGPPLSPRR